MATLAKRERVRFSYKDYCKWTDDRRWELIDGIEYDMSPAPSRVHQKLSGELFVRIYNALEDRQYVKAEIYADLDIIESTVIEGLKIAVADLFGLPSEPTSSEH